MQRETVVPNSAKPTQLVIASPNADSEPPLRIRLDGLMERAGLSRGIVNVSAQSQLRFGQRGAIVQDLRLKLTRDHRAQVDRNDFGFAVDEIHFAALLGEVATATAIFVRSETHQRDEPATRRHTMQ